MPRAMVTTTALDSVHTVDATDRILVHSDRTTCAVAMLTLPPALAPLLLRGRGAPVPGWAWYSTDSAVNCMNASSRDACCGLRSCSTTPSRAASSPIFSAGVPSTSSIPSAASTTVTPEGILTMWCVIERMRV
ncbi:hypothetical protein STENM223S_06712 [Streptomyces tendae]